jgi:TrmH family RNA methyltransferase
MITSTGNSKIKYIRRLISESRFRRAEKAYVVEGTRWLSEMRPFPEQIQLILVTESWLHQQDNRQLVQTLDLLDSSALQIVSEQVMAHASDTETPSGVLAVVSISPLPLPHSPNLLLILDRIADPGNLGTILRTSAAAGVDGVLLGPGCVDPYNPKVVRSSMGAHLRLPLLALSWPEIEQLVDGMAVWLAAADGHTPYAQVNWQQPSALIIGSEAAGAGQQASNLAQKTVYIPMHSQTESLNAAVATGILLFERLRQRKE